MLRASVRVLVVTLAACVVAQAQAPAGSAAERAFAAAKKSGAPALYAFLKPFPKGADLHMHLSGAIYAETFIREAAEQNVCVDTTKLGFVPNKGLTKSLPPQPVCAEGAISAADVMKNQQLYDRLINSFSMRSFVPSQGYSGHDQFFNTFDRFGGLKNVAGEWLDEVARRAAAQNEQYLEIMQTPSFSHAIAAEMKTGWPAEFNDANHMQVLAKLRDELFANGLRDDVEIDAKELGDAQLARASIERCADALKHDPNNGMYSEASAKERKQTWSWACGVRTHFLYQVLRGFSPQQVFAQTLLGFELATAHPDLVVGINFVRAEDRRDAMEEYHTEMLMLDYLHSVYPKVHISLHAGELAPGLVPPAGMSFHIREAVELGHAERIGHGVDILSEDRPQELLKEMAAKKIDVEINLISNLGILGVTGTEHPLNTYRAAHVPFSLSTDDEGVSRTDLTRNYVQAVMDQGLGYADLKLSARNSLEFSFLPGESLYLERGNYIKRKPVCAGAITSVSKVPPACLAFLKTSEKAMQQYELETRFAAFESSVK